MQAQEPSILNPAFRFLLMSSAGIAMFLAPIPFDGTWTIPLGIVSQAIRQAIGHMLPAAVVFISCVSAGGALLYGTLISRPRQPSIWEQLFRPGPIWLALRCLGAVTAFLVWQQMGPDWLWSANIGGVVLNELLVSVLVSIAIGCAILPLLTDYGLMEFVGTYMERGFRQWFTLPGRSAVDALASWLGGSSVGLVVTAEQLRGGFYSYREAAVIATNFSIVSITFAYVIVDTANLLPYFFPFYGVLILSGVTCSIILPRIPPLSRKSDARPIFDDAEEAQPSEAGTVHRRAWRAALGKASKPTNTLESSRKVLVGILDIWLGVLPVAMVIATFFLAIAELTPIFDWLALPFEVLLGWIGVAENTAAAPAFILGFADMFLPALVAADIQSVETRFIVAVIAVGQLIFMSETGIMILKLGLPLTFLDLIAVFLLRTLVIFPIAVLSAQLIF